MTFRPLEVEIRFPVRAYDVDFTGIVSNITYIRWLEDLRLTVLEKYYPFPRLLAEGLSPIMMQTRIQYWKPVRMFDDPVGRMWLAEMQPVKALLVASFSVGEQVAAYAEQLYCFVNTATGRPAEQPADFQRQYHAILQEHGGAPPARLTFKE